MSGAPGCGCGGLDLRQGEPRMVEKGPAGGGQFDAVHAALHKLCADLEFEIADLPAERRLRGMQPDVSIDLAIAQIISATNYIRLLMPPGIQSPLVVQCNASSVPVLQISLSSDTLNEQQLYDYGLYNLRQRPAPIHGVTFPTPAGGKYRQIMVDLDPAKLLAKGLTPLDVANAVNAQNLTLPSGTAKIGNTQYTVRTNAIPATIAELNNIPVKYATPRPLSAT